MNDCSVCPGPCAGCPKVVAIGGGHGLAVTIKAARQYAGELTAVVATADDGGSTGRLRAGMSIPAPGDLRRCLVAMAGGEAEPLGAALDYRFDGTDVEGHALGNLVLAALCTVTGGLFTAAEEVGKLLGTDTSRHRVVPATAEPVELHATTAEGELIRGQVAVAGSTSIEQVHLVAEREGPDGVVAAPGAAGLGAVILAADQIVLGPGDLFTSVLAAAVVAEVRAALAETPARQVYVCNLAADNAETKGYDVASHLRALWAHDIRPDVVLVDPASDVASSSSGQDVQGAEVVEADLARPHGLAHDSTLLASALAGLCR